MENAEITYKIDRGINPPPKGRRGRAPSKAALTLLACDSGDSFVINTRRDRTIVENYARKNKIQIVTRTTDDAGTVRIWRLCAQRDADVKKLREYRESDIERKSY